MDVNVDVGPNTKDLLEGLAEQIGITVDTIFPWFVRQQVMEGYLFLVLIAILTPILVVLLVISIRKTDGSDTWFGVGIFSAIGCFLVTFSIMIEVPVAVTKIYNPEFHAVKDLTKQLGRLRGGSGR